MPTNPDDDRTILQPVNGTSSLNAKATLFESNNSLAIGTKLGEFEITGLIGEGGFGIVYLALLSAALWRSRNICHPPWQHEAKV